MKTDEAGNNTPLTFCVRHQPSGGSASRAIAQARHVVQAVHEAFIFYKPGRFANRADALVYCTAVKKALAGDVKEAELRIPAPQGR